jgi:hypothetical protein
MCPGCALRKTDHLPQTSGPDRCVNTCRGLDRPPDSDRRTTVSTIPPPEPRDDIAELLRPVGAVRRLAFDRTLPPSEALGRIRDAYHDYDADS